MGKRKTITICSTSFHEYDRRLQRIAAALMDAGYQVQWISRSVNKSYKTIPTDGISHLIIRTFFKSGIFFYLEFNIRLLLRLLRTKTDGITSVDLDTTIGCCISNVFKRKILFFDAHEIFYEVPELEGKPIKKGIWKAIARIFLPRIKQNYTVNQSLSKHYSERYRSTYKVIRNVPFSSTVTPKRDNNKKIVYLGVLNKGRGLELAIEAMKTLSNYELILVGEGDKSEQLRSQASGMENIIFKGFIQPSDLKQILKNCSIGINMLESSSLNYKLSLANKFFDYMHAGIPSINMAYPEYNHILSSHEVGIAVNNYDAKSFIEAVRSLEDKTYYARLASNCNSYKSHYTWEAESKKLLDIYAAGFNS